MKTNNNYTMKICAFALVLLTLFSFQANAQQGSVEFSQLSNNQVIEQGQELQIEAILNGIDDSISEIELSIDGEFLRRERVSPYLWGERAGRDTQLSNLSVGQHTLSLVAIAQSGSRFTNSITVDVVADADAVGDLELELIHPSNLDTFIAGDSLTALVAANQADGAITKVDLFYDGTFVRSERRAPYEWGGVRNSEADDVFLALTAGNHTLTVNATAQNGATKTISLDFNVEEAVIQSNDSGGEVVNEAELDKEQVDIDIIRFLNQSTFGATEESYNEIRAQVNDNGDNLLEVYEDWIDTQLDRRATNMTDLMVSISENEALSSGTRFEREHTFWTLAINSPDQLRHRLAQTLSEILVISDDVNPILNAYRGLTTYWDMLASSGDGSYEDLLEGVTRHTSMGTYLSHLQNEQENSEEGFFPDENYAREIMQLFSFGLVHLNKDGSIVLDDNNTPIPTYNNEVISEMARVLTGLSLSVRSDVSSSSDIINTNFSANSRNASGTQAQWTAPMRFFPDRHDFGEKKLFIDNGQQVVIEARGATIEAADQELSEFISAIVGHSSTAPRISRLLIQQLVTSNPSGAYIERVANAFGEDGDIRATIKAILLDQEARNPNVINIESFGKQKSPLLQLTSFMRLADMSSEFYLDGRNSEINFANTSGFDGDATFLRIGSLSTTHQNLEAPSVFNFYSPEYSPPGEFGNSGLVAPEMELLTETALFDTFNDIFELIDSGTVDGNAAAYTIDRDEQFVNINRERLTDIFEDAPGDDRDKAAALVDYLDFYYNASQIALTNDISGTRDFIIDAVVNSDDDERIDMALYGVVNAPESLVQK